MKNLYVFGEDCQSCAYGECPIGPCKYCPNTTDGKCNCEKDAPVDGLHCPYYVEAEEED